MTLSGADLRNLFDAINFTVVVFAVAVTFVYVINRAIEFAVRPPATPPAAVPPGLPRHSASSIMLAAVISLSTFGLTMSFLGGKGFFLAVLFACLFVSALVALVFSSLQKR